MAIKRPKRTLLQQSWQVSETAADRRLSWQNAALRMNGRNGGAHFSILNWWARSAEGRERTCDVDPNRVGSAGRSCHSRS